MQVVKMNTLFTHSSQTEISKQTVCIQIRRSVTSVRGLHCLKLVV